MQVKFKKLTKGAITPRYATPGAGCFDIHVDGSNWNINAQAYGVDVLTTSPQAFNTGLSFEIPKGYVMLIFSRSGHGFKNSIRLSNCVGVIDSDYRGELMVKLHADSQGAFNVKAGDRIAQGFVIPLPEVEFVESEDLSDTQRGTGGLGSTGT